eukprot:Pompholyxophrys_sp_v1_NODE_306_length_797_cov_86.673709.p1 type:complete len:106 gc:universal NODE_306_length_797_cov_86.673709:55-372(+)
MPALPKNSFISRNMNGKIFIFQWTVRYTSSCCRRPRCLESVSVGARSHEDVKLSQHSFISSRNSLPRGVFVLHIFVHDVEVHEISGGKIQTWSYFSQKKKNDCVQ